MSFPATLGVLSYCVTALLGVLAGRASGRKFWFLVTAVFTGLALWRVAGAEDAIRGLLRDQLAVRDLYGGRRGIQAAFVLILAATGAGMAVVILKRRKQLGSRLKEQWWAESAMSGLLVLITLRLISLSAIDRILFGGPVHLNWFLEGGLVAMCAISAACVWRRHG